MGPKRLAVHGLVIIAGAAALSWEVLWQLETSLALGYSAMGTAITLCMVMGGMTCGALGMGLLLRKRPVQRPLRLYGLVELVIGLSGVLMTTAFIWLESLDTWLWSVSPSVAPLAHIFGIVVILGPPTLAMGGTIPLLGLVALQLRGSIAVLYSGNTFGACLGTLLMAFVVLPELGINASSYLLAGINFGVFGFCWWLAAALAPGRIQAAPIQESSTAVGVETTGDTGGRVSVAWSLGVVFATGFATFALEVAWFRAFRAALFSTTDSFAIMLAAVLVALALAARAAPLFRRDDRVLAKALVAGGAMVLVMTPVVERFDSFVITWGSYYLVALPGRFLQVLCILGPAVFLIGLAVPWLLEQRRTTRDWAHIYAVNTLGAVAGATLSAWLLLPMLGFARTAWLAAVFVAGMGIYRLRGRDRLVLASVLVVALSVAVAAETGVGKTRTMSLPLQATHTLLEFREGPDSTIAAVEYPDGNRALIIDGFQASSEFAGRGYMTWMGALPMILHPDPREGLVICFGTGQTANAMRKEGIAHLDIVDLNEAVFELAHNFPTNEGILEDPRVETIVMDGRAWMRRTERTYDVITLEPMPPMFAGANALYSLQFYEAAERRLNAGGIIAQWLPFHLVPPNDAIAISKSFRSVFPDAILWIEPGGSNGILLGRASSAGQDPLGTSWPGLARAAPERPLSGSKIKRGVWLRPAALQRYSFQGESITDDNQRLAYGGLVARLQAMPTQGLKRHLSKLRAAQPR